MISQSFKAKLYDNNNSKAQDVLCEVTNKQLVIKLQDKRLDYSLQDVSYSSRLGKTPRQIHLPNNLVCETLENDVIDAIVQSEKEKKYTGLIHNLESKFIYFIPTIVLVVLVAYASVKYALPAGAKATAQMVPLSVAQNIGSGSMELLDKAYFTPSELPQDRKKELRLKFQKFSTGIQNIPVLHFEFRKSKLIGANAFALPDGSIVFTDELVNLSKNDEELLSILGHEIGHVEKRHALQRLFQDTAVFVVVSLLTQDVSSSASMLSALPTILIESAYSREFETEADVFAKEMMMQRGIPLHSFVDIMSRITKTDSNSSTSVLEYISSHPSTQERLKLFTGK